ncbi:PKD domain-containing protein, partial [Mangrovimonas sp. CR14]|uniref:PKD domain-containing protein n=1 Tax=Mangrovimonas sp. CR14 TaxID=2706120 RepID=UPI0014200BF7
MKYLFTISLCLFFAVVGWSQDILMQNGTFTQCSGTLYDSGGSTSGYSLNENYVLTICPEETGQFIQLDFTAFSTQLNSVFMYIYDGEDTTAPLIGTYSGGGPASSPGTIEASTSNASGCITIEFDSTGGSATGATLGFAADIACVTPCQDITASIDSTIPSGDGSGTIFVDLNETVTFNGSGTFSLDGSDATYSWTFDDGNTATGQTVTYEYTEVGIYTVSLIITDTNPLGCQSSNTPTIQVIVGASLPGNPYVDAGNDVELTCEETCTTLFADFLDIGETDTYNIESIVYAPPFPFSGLSNSMNTNIDDAWSEVGTLPFDFCFFGDTETQFQVGSNGVIRFEVDPSDTGNAWAFTQNLPNNTNATLAEANVFTPCHDINPATSDSDEIAWEVIGTYPNRVLAVSFYNVNMYSCNSQQATHMAVFYETTNVIDVYIKNKPVCNSWQGGAAVVGIQNNAGTEAYVPPGRQTSDSPWEVDETLGQSEAWRFVPNGDSIIEFAWLDSDGNVVSTDPEFEACPSQTTTYTAQVTYNICNGETVVVTDDVTVTVPLTGIINPVEDMVQCDDESNDGVADFDLESQTPGILGTQNPDDFTVTYHSSFADADSGTGALDSPYTASGPSTPIWVNVQPNGTPSCPAVSPDPVFYLIIEPFADTSFTVDPTC